MIDVSKLDAVALTRVLYSRGHASRFRRAVRFVVGRIEDTCSHFKLTTDPPEDRGYAECQKNIDIFLIVEAAVELHISRNRDLRSPDVGAADEIRTVLGWCETCHLKSECLTDMIRVKHTGIAGGKFLHEGGITA